MRRHTRIQLIALMAMLAVAGCASPSTDNEAPAPSSPGSRAPAGPAGVDGTGTDGTGSGGANQPGPQPAPEPSPAGGGGGDTSAAGLARVLLLPVDLIAPERCFTEGLETRYVEGYGAQLIDPRPHGDLAATRVEHEGATRLRMDVTERRVHLLPGSSRAVEAKAGAWTVALDINMTLSGGFLITYSRSHRSQTGQFRQVFTSPVDNTCTVELVYAITTSPVP